ncbi:MAG TPA: hypothetical protein VI894_00745 [Candidatus Nanoarchaeia archaeon]|nr:hypothetical protein [Candidatus Nanoarchaeia archaeon]
MSARKGQMEIMGLAMIVILLSVGLLFYLRFSISKPEQQAKEEFTKSERASNMLSSLLSTTTDCRDASIKSLLVDCAGNPTIFCSGKSSCEYSYGLIDKLFNKTIKSWKAKYDFTVSVKTSGSQRRIMRVNSSACYGERETKFETIPLYPNPGNLEARLEIC